MRKGCALYDIPYIYSENLNDLSSCDYIWSPSVEIPRDPGKKYMFGPHFFVFPETSFISSEPKPTGVFFNCLSPWVKTLYEEFGEAKYTLKPLPFGVDTNEFFPSTNEKTHVLVYFKNRNRKILDYILRFYSHHKIDLIEYGKYNENQYKEALKRAKFAVWIGTHESQGFALQECLSCNVPILIIEAKTMKDECNNGVYPYAKMDKKMICDVAPYWDESCGLKISEWFLFADFKGADWYYPAHHPRDFIFNNLSIRKCFDDIIAEMNKS